MAGVLMGRMGEEYIADRDYRLSVADDARWSLGPGVVEVGTIRIDASRNSVSVAGETVPITGQELKFLYLLAINDGRVLSQETILSRLNTDAAPGLVNTLVCRTRKKLGAAAPHLRTHRGLGFSLTP